MPSSDLKLRIESIVCARDCAISAKAFSKLEVDRDDSLPLLSEYSSDNI